MSHVGIVIIGRNEGERLRRCLASIPESGGLTVYVDSGSTDGSVELARQMGAVVVMLDLSMPFSAARARNVGFEKLMDIVQDMRYVQFVDGDCELASNWLQRAVEELEKQPVVAAVCGRLRERFPETSIYNRLCDMEWNGPVGEISACGGIAMYRAAAFHDSGGFNPFIVAGEEPELCARLRQKGWRITRIDAEMAMHDAAMFRFSQWWKRSVRAGHAYAQNAALHGRAPARHRVKETRSITLWGVILPVLVLGLLWPSGGWSLPLLVAYPLLIGRIYRHMRKRGFSPANSRLYACFCALAKFPQAIGLLRFHLDRWRSRTPTLIEYKQPVPSTADAAPIVGPASNS
ncbi:MAG: glycosyltransferase [Bacillota bacterium]